MATKGMIDAAMVSLREVTGNDTLVAETVGGHLYYLLALRPGKQYTQITRLGVTKGEVHDRLSLMIQDHYALKEIARYGKPEI